MRWSYRYNGKQKLMPLGKYPEVPLVLARSRHADGRKLLTQGTDPMAERKSMRIAVKVAEENSFECVASKWLEHWKDGKSLRHVDSTRRRLEANILPAFGHLLINDVEAPDIARRAIETTGQVFRYALASGYTRRNPAVDFKPRDILRASHKVNHARVDVKELPDLLRQIEVYQGTHVTRLAMKLIALTFVRPSELIGAKGSEFDFEEERWDIPKERMKMRTPHIVPLAKQTVEILATLRDLTGDTEWLFPGDRNRSNPMSNNTILKALERMGYRGRMTGHGFRGLASTILHEREYTHEYIELQLAYSHAMRSAQPTIMHCI